MFRLVLSATALLAGSAALSADDHGWRQRQEAQQQAKFEKAIAGLTPGRTTDCVSQINTRNARTERFGGKILYRISSRKVYVTDTGGGCFGLSRGDAIVTKSFGGDLCRGDIVQTVDLTSRSPSGSCTFGSFQEYTK